ncbi:MAG: class I SAM-dependent methyltransferase [Planctomycetales bacterium]
MSFFSDVNTLFKMVFHPIRGKTHSERLESFYANQASGYDDYRKRLLQGREEMYQSLPIQQGDTLLDMGGGTGANLEFLGDRIQLFSQIQLVDLSTSLLKVARERFQARGWTNVATVEADATQYRPTFTPDLMTFSYSLTMIPDWFAAIDHALDLLKPGGTIGVVDFYVSRKYPAEGHIRHSQATQFFWPTMFRNDNVYPSPDHVPYLHRKFVPQKFVEARARVPFMPGFRVPYYIFIGKKPN